MSHIGKLVHGTGSNSAVRLNVRGNVVLLVALMIQSCSTACTSTTLPPLRGPHASESAATASADESAVSAQSVTWHDATCRQVIAGRVVTAAGTAVAGVVVKLSRGDGYYSSKTRPDGSFSFSDVWIADSYQLCVGLPETCQQIPREAAEAAILCLSQ
jgi:hypothetical protein